MATIFNRLLLAKSEVTKGTDPTPTPAANAVRCTSFKVTPTVNAVARPAVKQSMGDLAHLMDTDSMVSVEIVCELKGSGAAGTAPDIGALLKACRMTETVVASTSVTYAPAGIADAEGSCTLYCYIDGLLWKVTGAVGTVAFSAQQGAAVTATFTMSGVYTTPTAVADPSGATYDATQPIIMSSADVVNDGTAVKVGAFSLDVGNNVAEHKVTGDHQFVVSNRAPTATFTKDSIATAAEWTALRNGTSASLSAALGATAGNIATITAPAGKRSAVAYGAREERDTLDVTYSLFESTTDDQYAIAFT